MSYSVPTHAVITYIEAHLKDEKIDHEALERSVGFSYAHIRDFFRRNTGDSLAHYVRIRKICVSAFELLHSEKAVLEVALQYGFSSHESYTCAFKAVTGSTPYAFRKARPLLGKEELTTGVYGIRFLKQKEQRSDAMCCLFDGSGSAAAYFKGLAEQERRHCLQTPVGSYPGPSHETRRSRFF